MAAAVLGSGGVAGVSGGGSHSVASGEFRRQCGRRGEGRGGGGVVVFAGADGGDLSWWGCEHVLTNE